MNHRDNIVELHPTESEEGLISEDEDNYPVVDRSSDARTAVVNTELPVAVTREGLPSCRDSHSEYTKPQRLRHTHRRQKKREQKQRRIPYRRPSYTPTETKFYDRHAAATQWRYNEREGAAPLSRRGVTGFKSDLGCTESRFIEVHPKHSQFRLSTNYLTNKRVSFEELCDQFCTAHPDCDKDDVTRCCLPVFLAFNCQWSSPQHSHLTQKIALYFLQCIA